MLSANKIEEIKEQAYCNKPSTFGQIGKVYPYTMNEIIEMGSTKYNGLLGILLLSENDIMRIIKEKTGEEPSPEDVPTPLDYLIHSAALDDMFLLELQLAFSTFFKEEVLILPKLNAVLVGDPAEKRLITFKNFSDFQDILRIQNRRQIKEPPPANETPGQRKMRLLREKVAEAKKKKKEETESSSLADMLEIAETFGIDLNKSLYAFYGLLRRNQMREKWNQDLQMICAGADSKSMKTKYWGEKPDKD